jgi:hypothetical protein
LILLLASCQPPAAQALAEDDLAAIRQTTDGWLIAHAVQDWDVVGRHYTEDAVIMPPVAPPIRGRAAIQSWFEANESDTRIEVAILDIWRRQRDGLWLVSVDMFSPDREVE